MLASRAPQAPFSVRRALSAAAGGGLAASLALGVLEARAKSADWLATAGLLAPAAFALGAAMGLVCWVLASGSSCAADEDAHAPVGDERSQAARTVAWVLAGPSGVFALFLAGQVSLALFLGLGEQPAVAGVVLSLSNLTLLVAVFVAVRALSLTLAGSVAIQTRAHALSRAGALALFFGSAILGAAALLALGETSGRGHALALFGVLRRPELQLGPVYELFGLLCAAVLAVRFARKREEGVVHVALGVLLLMGGFAFWTASRMDSRTAIRIERARGLAGVLLPVWSGSTDDDRDGVSAAFGGGDCDDARSDVHPGALEQPGNGLDEDCSGADARLASQRPFATAAAARPGLAEASGLRLPTHANVVLLTVDTLRHDLGFARKEGAPRLSPHLDALAARSTVFERAYALASYTSKSLGPMLLGRYCSESPRSFEHFDRFAPAVPFLQERLQAAGHRTVSAQAYWYFFFPGYGFERGWDVLDHRAAPKLVAVDGDRSVTGDKLADRAIEQLTALDAYAGRFFFWAHWVDPHSEYVPHPDFDFGGDSRQRYDGEVAFVDQQVGRVLAALAARPFSDRTVVLFTSDHGEAFGEHGMIRHGFELWEELARVPLILHVPGAPPRRVVERRSLIDVVPTVLEAMGVVEEAGPGQARGTSLIAEAIGTGQRSSPARPVFIDMPKGPHNQERRAFLLGDEKLVVSAGRVIGLYDLAVDPGEKHDLSDDVQRSSRMERELAQFLTTLTPAVAR